MHDVNNSMISKISRIFATFESGSPQSASDVARKADLPLATTHRIMVELEKYHLLERSPAKQYRIGLRLWELGTKASPKVSLRDIAMPYMSDLHRMTMQHTQLAILDGTDIVYLAKLSEPDAAVNITDVAERLPAWICSPGILLAAFASEETRERILALPRKPMTPQTIVERSELQALMERAVHKEIVELSGWMHLESTGLATPIRDAFGEVVAALTVIVPSESSLRQSAKAPLLMAGRAISHAVSAASRLPVDREQAILRHAAKLTLSPTTNTLQSAAD